MLKAVAVLFEEGGSSSGVTSIDGITGSITLVEGSGITITDNFPSPGDITIAATGAGSGTVTSVSVVSANGFAGTVANSTTTPAITLTSTLSSGVVPYVNNTGQLVASNITSDGTNITVGNNAAIVGTLSVSGGNFGVSDLSGDIYTNGTLYAAGYSTFGSAIQIDGELVDSTFSPGTINYILSSTGTGTKWIPQLRMGNLYWGAPTNGTITLIAYSAYAFTINELFQLQTTSGSIVLTININGTPVTGLHNITVNSTPQNIPATAANLVAVGNQLTMVLSSNSSAVGLVFTMEGTE